MGNPGIIYNEDQITITDPDTGAPKMVPRNSLVFDKVLAAYRDEDYDEMLRLSDLGWVIKQNAGDLDVDVVGGVVTINDYRIPDALVNKVMEFANNGLPYNALLEFGQNLMLNPSKESRDQLYGFLEVNNIPITTDGCFIAYKGVRRNVVGDLVDTRNGRFLNNPGCRVEMPRDEVDDNPYQTCSVGLHVAAHQFANNWSSVLISVKVHPKDVVSVPYDYDGQKMRTCGYEVLAVLDEREEITDPLVDIVDEFGEEEEDLYNDEDDWEDDETPIDLMDDDDWEDDETPIDLMDDDDWDADDFPGGDLTPQTKWFAQVRLDGKLELPYSLVETLQDLGYKSFLASPDSQGLVLYLSKDHSLERNLLKGTRLSKSTMQTCGKGPNSTVHILFAPNAAVEIL